MTDERIEKIKSAVETADHIPAEKKAELLALLENLKPAIAKVAETHPDSNNDRARRLAAKFFLRHSLCPHSMA